MIVPSLIALLDQAGAANQHAHAFLAILAEVKEMISLACLSIDGFHDSAFDRMSAP